MGRGYNKMEHVYELSEAGYRMVVLAKEFVVHVGRAHFPSKGTSADVSVAGLVAVRDRSIARV